MTSASAGSGTGGSLGADEDDRAHRHGQPRAATLVLAANNVLWGGSSALIPNIPTLVVTGGTVTSANYNGVGNVTLNSGATLTNIVAAGTLQSYHAYEFLGTVTVGGTSGSTISGSGADHLAGGAGTTFIVASTGAGTELTVSASLMNGSLSSPEGANAAGALIKTGTGTMLLSAANAYTGATTVSAGTLRLGVAGAFHSGNALSVASGATFDANGNAFTASALSGAGTVTLGTATATLASGGTITAGTAGAGTLTVSGGNLTFAGTGTVNIGTVANYTSTAAVNVTGALALNGGAGAVTINISAASVASGVYLLLGFDSGTVTTGDFTLGTNPVLGGRLVVNGNNLDYVVSDDSPKWTGAEFRMDHPDRQRASNWKLVTARHGDRLSEGTTPVLFDDSATGNTSVNISTANVQPDSVTFNNSTLNYHDRQHRRLRHRGNRHPRAHRHGAAINTANTYSGTTISAGAPHPATRTHSVPASSPSTAARSM